MNLQTQPWLLPILLVAFWLFVSTVSSWLSGWRQLAKLYPAPLKITGRAFSFCTVGLGNGSMPLRYRLCARAGVNEQGIALTLYAPFRFMHPPMWLPWSAIESATPQKWLKTSCACLQIKGFDKKVLLPGALGLHILTTYDNTIHA